MGHIYPYTGKIPVVFGHLEVITAHNCYIVFLIKNLKQRIPLFRLKSYGGKISSFIISTN